MADDKKDFKPMVNMPNMRGGAGHGGPQARFAPTQKPKNAKDTLKRLVKIYMSEYKSLLIAIVFVVLSSLLALAIPKMLGKAIDTFNIKSLIIDNRLLNTILLVLLFAYIASWFSDLMQGYIMAGVSQKMVKKMRKTFFAKLQKLPLGFFDTSSHGDIMSRMTNDIDNISGVIAQATTQLISAAITITGALIIMLMSNVILTLAALVTVPLIFLLTKTITGRTRQYFKGQQEQLGKLNGIIEESVYGLRMVKAFNREEAVIGSFNEVNEQLREMSTKAQIWSGYLMPIMNIINNIGFATLALVGGVLAIRGDVTIGTITSFISYSRQFGRPLNDIAAMLNTLQSALAGAERVFEVLDVAEERDDIEGAKVLVNPYGDVAFDKVSFSYNPQTPVLRNISFKANKGEAIAIVGATGAGKTTIVNLLTRFYEADSGSVLIDGNKIDEYTRDSLRKCFSVVLQDTCLFTGTVMDNIRYSKPDAIEDEVIDAAVMANANSFIKRLPYGYNTIITGNSDSLSQGQRQLLAIARAVLCDAPILILDEATSSVDTRTEFKIQEAMLKLMNGKTSFIIAHRLSTIHGADKIIVIEDGQIAEIGNHGELMGKKGIYYRMYTSQIA